MEKRLQVAASVFKNNPFNFQHPLLLVVRQHEIHGRTSAARIDDSMPRRPTISAMHCEANGTRGVTFAKQLRDLSVGHYPARWNTTNQFIDSFPILWITRHGF